MEALVLKPFKASLDQSLNDALTPRFQRWQMLKWMMRNTVITIRCDGCAAATIYHGHPEMCSACLHKELTQ